MLTALFPHPRAPAVLSAENMRVKGKSATQREERREVLQFTAVQEKEQASDIRMPFTQKVV